MADTPLVVRDREPDDLIRSRQLLHQGFGHAVGDVEDPPAEPLERLADRHRPRGAVGLRGPRLQDVEARGDEHRALPFGQQPGRLRAEIRGNMGPEG